MVEQAVEDGGGQPLRVAPTVTRNRYSAQASMGQDSRRRSRIKRWSSQLNCAGVRRRRLGHSNRFSTIGVSLDDVEGQLLKPARGDGDVFL